MRNKMFAGFIPQGRRQKLLTAAAVTLMCCTGAMTAFPQVAQATETRDVSGQFKYAAQLPGVCGPSAIVCATGTFSGGIQGSFTNMITSLVPSALVQERVDFYTGSIVIKTSAGKLDCDLAGALQDTGDGEFGEICVVTGGTGIYAGASGHLQLTGMSDTSGLPVLGLKGTGDYHGKIVMPAVTAPPPSDE